jgi:hypothetical protein
VSVPGKGWAPIAALVALVLFASGADAATRYASPSGSGSACTGADPCTLRQAIEAPAVRHGDEVVVRRGTYNLGASHILVDKGITVRGSSIDPRPRIVSSDSTSFWVFHRDAAVRDLEFVNTAMSPAVTLSDGILDRVVARSGGTGCALFPDVVGQTPVLRNSFCWGTTASAGYGVQWGIGAGTELSWTSKLRNVTAIGGLTGLRMDAGSGPVHLRLDAVNVIVRGGTDEDIVALANPGGNSIRAIFKHSNYATRAGFAGTGSRVSITAPGAGANQVAAPVFRDPATGDFHQRRTSRTINHGVDTPLNGPRDIDHQRRSLGSAPDIGGDEIPPG